MESTPRLNPRLRKNRAQDSQSSSGAGILEVLREYGCLTDHQLAVVTERQSTTIRKQANTLFSKEAIGRVQHRRGQRGRPISVNYLPDADWGQAPSREHQLQLNDVRLGWSFSGVPAPGLTIRTWDTQTQTPPPEVPPKLAPSLESPAVNGEHVRPDAMVLLQHEQARRPLVVFVELDRGTEALSRSSTRQSSWAMKARLYQQTAQLICWRDWVLDQVSSQQDAVCRLAVVTTSIARLTSIDDTLQLDTPALGVWLTLYSDFIERSPWASIWQRSGENTPRPFIPWK